MAYLGLGPAGTVLIGDGTFSDSPSVTSIAIADAPVNPTDGVNKFYADSIASGITFISSVQAASTTALTATYANGAAGVGATLTNAGTQLAFAIDGYSTSVNDRILIKDQAAPLQNGVYLVTVVGTGATNWILTRTTDYDQTTEIKPGSVVPVSQGSTNAGTSWIEIDNVTAIGTDPIQFNPFTSAPIMTTQYDVLVGGAGNTIGSVGPGTALQVLQSGGNAANPAYSTTTYPATSAQGDLIFASANNVLSALTKDTNATRYLSNTGTTNNPAWAQIALTTGVTGTLPVGNGGLGQANPTNHALIVGQGTSPTVSLGTGNAGQVLQSSGASADPAFSTATYPAIATGTGTLLRADGTNWSATTSTYPNTNAISTLIYASASNVLSALATANDGLLVTNNTGVPSILAGPGTTGNILQANAAAAPSFSTATYPSVGTSTGSLLRADGTNWSVTTSTYPNTNAINTLLYASAANVMSALATANNGMLVTSNTGVPSILAGPGTTGNILQSNTSAAPSFSTATYPSVGTSTGSFLRADGTNWSVSTMTLPNTAAISTILYASAANVISALATANNGILVTSNTGVPSILVGPGATGKILQSNTSAAPSYSTATYPSVATGTATFMRADGTNWVASTMTLPDTAAVSTILYASATNVISALATGNDGVLITSHTGVPSLLANGTTGQVLTATTGAPPSWQPAASSTLTFIDQGSSTTIAANTGYFVTGNFAMTLPASPSQGDQVIIVADTASVVSVIANTSQIIRIGDTASSAAGTITNSARGDSLTLRYRSSSTTWISVATEGTWNF